MKQTRSIIRCHRGQAVSESDWLASETPVTIVVNNKQYLTLLTTPTHWDELAVGFCLAEGLINNREDLIGLRVSQETVELELSGSPELAARMAATRVLTTGCGKGTRYWRALDGLKQRPVTGKLSLPWAKVTGLMKEFIKASQLFEETGSVHSAALAREGLQVVREDVARHNAVDKLVGHLVLNYLEGGDFALLTSGRISSELVLKAARANLGLIASRSAPTALAAELAEDLNITLLGFVRGERFNIYTHSWRVEGL